MKSKKKDLMKTLKDTIVKLVMDGHYDEVYIQLGKNGRWKNESYKSKIVMEQVIDKENYKEGANDEI